MKRVRHCVSPDRHLPQTLWEFQLSQLLNQFAISGQLHPCGRYLCYCKEHNSILACRDHNLFFSSTQNSRPETKQNSKRCHRPSVNKTTPRPHHHPLLRSNAPRHFAFRNSMAVPYFPGKSRNRTWPATDGQELAHAWALGGRLGSHCPDHRNSTLSVWSVQCAIVPSYSAQASHRRPLIPSPGGSSAPSQQRKSKCHRHSICLPLDPPPFLA